MKIRPLLPCLLAAVCLCATARAQSHRKSPSSKLYVSDIVGDVQIDTGTEIDDLTKKSVYNAQGTAIETKTNSNASVVLSNGIGLYFDVATRVEVREFEQEAFRPNRSDIEEEPSISRTHLFVDHGVMGISTSKMVAGSSLEAETSLATALIHGRQCVIHAEDAKTVISMLQGDATVQAGPMDHPHMVKNHQQAIIIATRPGEPNIVTVQDMPEGPEVDHVAWLEDRVSVADAGRALVYFEVQARRVGGLGGSAGGAAGGDVQLFDGTAPANVGDGNSNGGDIVAVPVLPTTPTVQTNVSPANL